MHVCQGAQGSGFGAIHIRQRRSAPQRVYDRADSTSRIAHAICKTAHRHGADLARGFEMPFTQAILGEITGQTSVNVNRVLRSFADRGLLSYSRNSIAGDGPELRRLARYDERYLA